MWEQTLIESKGFGRATKRWWTIPTAAGLHAVLIITVLLASYWHVEAVEAPLTVQPIFIPVVITPPPAIARAQSGPGKTGVKQPAKFTQPDEIPAQISESSIPIEPFAPETVPGPEGSPYSGEGVQNGVEGGWGTWPLSTGIGIAKDEQPRMISTGVTTPVLIKRVEPEYPRMAAIIRLQGMVVLEAVITKMGDVEQVRTLRADHVLFEKAATDAVLQWKYKPALVQGRPVKVYFTVTVTFRLR